MEFATVGDETIRSKDRKIQQWPGRQASPASVFSAKSKTGRLPTVLPQPRCKAVPVSVRRNRWCKGGAYLPVVPKGCQSIEKRNGLVFIPLFRSVAKEKNLLVLASGRIQG